MHALVCPACHGSLTEGAGALRCDACARTYPVVAGIPDLRLEPDPYIGLEADRAKAQHLADAARTRSFEELVRYYYAITPEDPPDLAERWTRRAVAGVALGHQQIDALALPRTGGVTLDLGCGTAGLTAALAARGEPAIGVDIALRWLIVASHRPEVRGAGVRLTCASASRLPFRDAFANLIVANDLIEHVDDAEAVVREAARVAAPAAVVVFTGNNRWAPLPEPNMHVWGVGYLPRTLQRRYVTRRRGDTHPYRITLRSAAETERMARAAGFVDVGSAPAALAGAHRGGGAVRMALAAYNRACGWPVSRALLRMMGPRWVVRARRG